MDAVGGPARGNGDGNLDKVEGCATCSTADMEAAPCAADEDADEDATPCADEGTDGSADDGHWRGNADDADAAPCADDKDGADKVWRGNADAANWSGTRSAADGADGMGGRTPRRVPMTGT